MNLNWNKILKRIGLVLFVVGTLDPMEGSILIAIGSVINASFGFIAKERHWSLLVTSVVMIVIGVWFLFFLSSLGGFGGKSNLSWWYGTLILPYPLGWLLHIYCLVTQAIQHRKKTND